MTQHARRFLLVLVVIAGAAVSGGADVLAQPVGYIAAIEGSATVVRDGVDAAAGVGAVVEVEDVLVTGPDSRVLLVVEDGSRIVIGADSRIALMFVVDAGRVSGDGVVELLRGILRIGVHQPESRPVLETRSPTAVVAARSTEWIMEYVEDRTAVLGVEGTVEVTATTAEGSVVLGPGFGTDVARGEPPTPPVEWGAARAQSARQRTTLGAP